MLKSKILLIAAFFVFFIYKGYTQIQPPETFPFVGEFYYQWIDFNRDGRKDFVVLDEFEDSLSIYDLNNLELKLLSQKKVSMDNTYVAADLAHDGLPEILYSTGRNIKYYTNNNGKIGTLVQAVQSPSLDFISINARDMDNDTDADLVVLMEDFNMYLIENKSNTFEFSDRVLITTAFTNNGSIHFCDYDQDGYMDILFNHPYHGVYIMQRVGHHEYTKTRVSTAGSFVTHTTGDFNGDGYPEIVQLHYSGSANAPLGFVQVFENPYGECCTAYYGGVLWFPDDIEVRNLDADPEPEILVCDRLSFTMFDINEENALERKTIYGAQNEDLFEEQTEMLIDDFDGDNKLEIIQSVWINPTMLYHTDFDHSVGDGPYTCDELPIPSLCPSGDLIVKSQEDLIELNDLYPNCTELNGSLVIEDVADIELWRAGSIRKIKGNLTISNTMLDSLDELNLFNVRGPIVIENNPNLSHIDFPNLTYAREGISILNNDMISSVNSFHNLNEAKKLTVTANDQLKKVNGFNSWEMNVNTPFIVTPQLEFIDNPQLDSISGFAEASGFELLLDNSPVEFIENLNLVSNLSILNSELDDLTPFTHVRSNIVNINNVSGIQSLAGLNPDAIYFFDIRNCPDLERIGFQAKISDLVVVNNASFHDLTGLHPTQPFLSDLQFINNPSLATLDGLELLAIFQGDLVLRDNALLTDISAIPDYSEYTDSVTITNNPQLSLCHTPFICSFIEREKPYVIEGNAGSCETGASVQDACWLISATDEMDKSVISIHPNPVADEIMIEGDVMVNKVVIYNANGEIVLEHSGKGKISLPEVVPGAYYVRVFTEDGVIVYKVIKV